MRDTLILLAFLLALAVTWFIKSRYSDSSPQAYFPAEIMQTTKGEKSHEAISRKRDPKNSKSGKDERSANPSDESEKLPTFYSRPGKKERSRKAPSAQAPINSEKRLIVHGVPLDDWAEAEHDAIAVHLSNPTGAQPELRLFVQCHEMTHGKPEYIGSKDCERLLAREKRDNSDPRGLLLPGPF